MRTEKESGACVCFVCVCNANTFRTRRFSLLLVAINSVELQNLKCYFNKELTALSISFSLIPFKATLFSCPKSIFHRCANFTEVRKEVSVSQAVFGQVSLPLLRSLLLLSSSFIALKEKRNERTNEQTDRKVIKLSHRISRTISAPPRALL